LNQLYHSTIAVFFFNNIVIDNFNHINTKFVEDAFKILSEKTGTIKITLRSAASAPANPTYNIALSKRRAVSVTEYLKTTKLGEFIGNTLTFSNPETVGEDETAIPKKSDKSVGASVTCTKDIVDKNNKTNNNAAQTYAVDAMACRRVVFGKIDVTQIKKEIVIEDKPDITIIPDGKVDIKPDPQPKKKELDLESLDLRAVEEYLKVLHPPLLFPKDEPGRDENEERQHGQRDVGVSVH
jgi:hypothetical protein